MGKYEPLGQFLRQQSAHHIPMSFNEIERLLGDKLPASSLEHRAWWSNNPSNNVMTRQWLDAGYETESVDLTAKKLVFRKVNARAPADGPMGRMNASKGQSGGKYRLLGEYLKRQDRERILMTFLEIEEIIGGDLPASKIYPAWWSNNLGNNTMTRQWLDAGYQSESIDTAGAKLVFKRVRLNIGETSEQVADEDLPDHPIWGSMTGTITVTSGVDLTQPMEFDWAGKLYNE